SPANPIPSFVDGRRFLIHCMVALSWLAPVASWSGRVVWIDPSAWSSWCFVSVGASRDLRDFARRPAARGLLVQTPGARTCHAPLRRRIGIDRRVTPDPPREPPRPPPRPRDPPPS